MTTSKRPPLPLLLALPAIALVLSGIITAINVGIGASDFVGRWLFSFVVSLPILPAALFVAISVEKFLGKATSSLPLVLTRLIASLITACVIEFCLATVVTWNNLGIEAVFGPQWLTAFLRSLPLGTIIALFMNFVVKPRYLEPAQ